MVGLIRYISALYPSLKTTQANTTVMQNNLRGGVTQGAVVPLSPLSQSLLFLTPSTMVYMVYFQMQPGLKLKPSYQNGIRLTVPSLFGQTSILPAGLLNTELPLDATRCLIILHPVATTTPHNVSRNADCRCAASKGKIFTFSVHWLTVLVSSFLFSGVCLALAFEILKRSFPSFFTNPPLPLTLLLPS